MTNYPIDIILETIGKHHFYMSYMLNMRLNKKKFILKIFVLTSNNLSFNDKVMHKTLKHKLMENDQKIKTDIIICC